MTDRIQTSSTNPHAQQRGHLLALGAIGFVHERLPSSDRNAGRWFVHESEYDREPGPTVRIIVDLGNTTQINVHDKDGWIVYTVIFDARCPADVVGAAAAAALRGAGL